MRITTSILLCLAFGITTIAQSNLGITGYGEIHTVGISSDKVQESPIVYLGSEGGLIINNNIIFGVYLNALTTPLFFDSTILPNDQQIISNPYSNHKGSIKTTLNNINLGIVTGLNISPEKTIQFTIKGHIGIGGVDFNDIIKVEDPMNPESFNFESYSSAAIGINTGIDFVLQIKLGSAVKIGFPIGYTFSNLFAESDSKFTNEKNVMKEPKLFSGKTVGFNITFGVF
jgi:hypothetical protein